MACIRSNISSPKVYKPNRARKLRHGEALMRLLRQDKHDPMVLHSQIITLLCADAGYFTDIPTDKIKTAQKRLIEYFEREHSNICVKIDHYKKYSAELAGEVVAAANDFPQ